MVIRSARQSEAGIISALALRAKSHWRYTPEQLDVFRGELTLSPHELTEKHAHVAEESGSIMGFYTLAGLRDEEMELEHIFVDPPAMSRGVGSRLFHHACALAASIGARVLVIRSDPNAAGFYHALGATLVGEIPSSIPRRAIPCFRYPLTQAETA